MRIDVKAEEVVTEVRAVFVAQIRAVLTALPPHEALQLGDALCAVWLEKLQGLRVTHRAIAKVDDAAIAEDWAHGLSWRDIVKKHGCSKTQAYRCHPSKQQRKAA